MKRFFSLLQLACLTLFFTLFLGLATLFSGYTHLDAGTLPPAPGVDLVVVTSAPVSEVDSQQAITFLISITNRGPESAPNVDIVDYLPLPYLDLLDCEAGNDGLCSDEPPMLFIRYAALPSGESRQVTVTARTHTRFVDPLHTFNMVQVSSTGVDSNLLDNHANVSITLRHQFDLALTQTITAPTPFFPEKPFQLALSVTNISPNLPYRLETFTFRNSVSISMPDTVQFEVQPALTYPALLTVSGVSSAVVDIDVSLFGISRTWSEDLDALLIAPNGLSVTLLSDVGAATDINGIDLTFDDSADTTVPNVMVIPPGRYRPTNFARKDESPFDHYPAPGPGDVFDPAPLLGRFHGIDPNGVWRLYLIDDQPRDVGEIRFGWGITFTQLVTSPLPITLTQLLPAEVGVMGSVSNGWVVTWTGQSLASQFVTATRADLNLEPLPPLILNLTSPLDPGRYTFSAELNGLAGERGITNNRAQGAFDISAIHDLTIQGTVEPPTVAFGSRLTYTFVISNLGPSLALNPIATIDLAEGVEVVQTSPSQGECRTLGKRVVCQLQRLQSVTRSLNYTHKIQIVALSPTDGPQTGLFISASAVVSEAIDNDLVNNAVTLVSLVANPNRFVYLPVMSR